MGIANLSDESILRLYNSVRRQVQADRGLRYKFMAGDAVKQYAAELLEEITRRQLQNTPIGWPLDP